MGKFVARPVWVNAWHIVPEQVSLLPDWLKGGLVKRREKGKMRIGVYFEGMRGKTYAIEGSWVVQFEDNSQAPFVISDKKFKERYKESAKWLSTERNQ